MQLERGLFFDVVQSGLYVSHVTLALIGKCVQSLAYTRRSCNYTHL